MQTVSVLYHPLPLTVGQILESPREPLKIHAQAALHWNLSNQNLRGGSQALVTLKLPQVIPLGNRNGHWRTSDGDDKWHGTTRNVYSHCCIPGGSKKKGSDELPAFGGDIFWSLKEAHSSQEASSSAVSSTLLGSGVPRLANETREHIASLGGNLGPWQSLFKIINETKDDFIQTGCLCK